MPRYSLLLAAQHHPHRWRPGSPFTASRFGPLVRILNLRMVSARQLCYGPYPKTSSATDT